MQLKAILCRTSTKKQSRNAYYKITPNLLFEYQCTSGKFIRLPNRIETFFARIGMLYRDVGYPNHANQYGSDFKCCLNVAVDGQNMVHSVVGRQKPDTARTAAS